MDDLDEEIQTLGGLAYLCDVSGRHEEAIAYMRWELKKYAMPGNAQNKAIVQWREGQAALMGFRFEIAKGYLETSVKSLKQPGLEHQRIEALNLLSRVYFYVGDFNRAEAVCN